MSNVIRIKRRTSGATGAPASLKSGELAYNNMDNTIYAGFGDDGGGNATSVKPVGGEGTFAKLDSPALTGTPTAPTAAADTSTTALATTAFVTGQASSTTPAMDGVASVGTSLKYARADHVHPSDTTKANLASPTLTGTPAAPTAAADTNTTQLATTAFVVGQASSTSPVMNGTAAIGTSLKYARADHVHPSDTSRAPLASPTFTGTPAAPTAAADTNTTQLATTAFVISQASSTTPVALGTAATGTSLKYARADHVHAMPTFNQIGAPTADLAMGGFKITNLADPVSAQDAATKAYVDATKQGLDVKDSVRAATTANLTLTAPGATIDGVAMTSGDRVLVKDQSTGSQNGIYIWNGSAVAMTRSLDANLSSEVTAGMFTFVEEGTVNADSGWVLTTNAPITLDTTALVFTQFSGAGQITAGAGLTKTGNQLDVGAGTGIQVNADTVQLAGQALAFHNLATNGFAVRTAADTITARSIAGTANRVTVTNGDGVSGNPTVDIASTYVGQSTITTLGTIGTGIWQGTTVAVAYGGTGVATLTGLVKGNGAAAFSAAVAGTDYHDTNSTIDGGTF